MNTARPTITVCHHDRLWCGGAQSLLINQDHINRRGIEPIVKLQVSTESKHFNKIGVQSRKVLIGKINASIWFHCMEKKY